MREGLSDAQQAVLENVETIFVLRTLYWRQNGITNSVIRKMKFMEDEWGYKPLVVFTDYNAELSRIQGMLKYGDYNEDQVHFNKGTRILGVYNYFQKSYGMELDVMEYKKLDDGKTRKEIRQNVYEIYDGDKLDSREHYLGHGGRLRLVERYKGADKIQKSIVYDDYGYVSKIRIHDTDNEEYCPLEYYYTTDRKLCIKTENRFDEKGDVEGRKNLPVKLTLYDDDGNVVKEFADDAELGAYCIEQIATDESKLYLVVCETGEYTRVPVMLTKNNMLKCCVVHSIYQENPRNPSSKPQYFYKHMCENCGRFDGIVFLTETERKDFVKQYGNYRNTFAIPHPYPSQIVRNDFDNRRRNTAVIISRFDPIKRINHAIDVFKMVVAEVPDAKLEIYGFGQIEEQLREQIKTLELENHVLMKGFTNDPASVFREATASIMTSIAEGYPLTLAESVCNGCPVFSYDLKYGPSDVIVDGKTGNLAPYEDKNALAEKLIEYFKDERKQRRYNDNCYSDAWRFSTATFLKSWLSFMEELYVRNLYKIKQ